MKKRIVSLLMTLALCLGLLPVSAMAASTYTPYGEVANVTLDGVTYYDIFRDHRGLPVGERSDEMINIYEEALTQYIGQEANFSGGPRYDSVASNWTDVAHGLYIANTGNISIDGNDGYSLKERHWAIMKTFTTGENTKDVPFYLNGTEPEFADETHTQAFPRTNWLINRISELTDETDDTSQYDQMEKFGVFASSNIEDLADDIATEIGGFFEDYTRQKFSDRQNIDSYQYINSKSGSDGREDLVKKLKEQGLKDQGPFFFTTQSVLAEYNDDGFNSKNDDTQMMTWGAIFYDFSVDYLEMEAMSSAINTGDALAYAQEQEANGVLSTELYDYIQDQQMQGKTVPGIQYEISTGDADFSVGGVNQSSEEVELTIQYGTTVSESASNTRSHWEENRLTESVNVGQSFSTEGMFGKFASTKFSWSIDVGFEASQMWTDIWEDTTTYTNESTSTTSSMVVLPGHTQILLSTGEGNTAFSLEYDAPIAIRYKVLLFGSYFMHEGNDGEVKGETFKFLGNFGNSPLAVGENAYAAGSIYNRFHNGKNYESLYGQDIDWTAAMSDSWNQKEVQGWASREIYAVDLEGTINEIHAMQPYSVTGGNLTSSVKSTNTTIYGLEPLYPLRKVASDKAFDYQLVVGDELYLDNIPLYGYNDANVPYYGFDPSQGQWKIVDASGTPVSSDVISVTTDPLTGFTTLKAIGAGTAYVQYFIDEGVYSSANQTGETQNVHVERIAIPITVTNETFEKGSILISGELVGYVGEELAIDTVLTAQIKDAEGKYQDRAITWELQENAGASITDNKITFTKPGTYHVRAVCGNVKSHVTDPWYEVTALGEKTLDKIEVSADNPMILYTDTLDLNSLSFSAQAYDQYGNLWTGDWKTGAVWYLDGEPVDADIVTALPAGDHTLVLEAGGATSEEITVRVVLDTPVVQTITPAGTSLPYTGGNLEFTLTGENLVDGMAVKAVCGSTVLTAVTSGSETAQTAVLSFPANTSSQDIMTYTVTAPGVTAQVLVAKAPATDESEELDLAAFRVGFKTASLTLTDNIALNFKATVQEPIGLLGDYTVGALFWTREPAAYTVLHSPALQVESGGVNGGFYQLESGTGYHVFTYDDIAAKEMNDTIYTVPYVKYQGRYIYGDPLAYSVAQFGKTVLNGTYSDEFKTLAVDMLNYGAEAQTYFNYRTDALANAGLTPEQLALGTQEAVELTNGQATLGTASDYAAFTAASLSLESYVSLNYKAAVNPMSGYTIDSVTMYYSDTYTDEADWTARRDAGELQSVPMANNGVNYTGSVRDIVAKGLRDSFYTQVQVTYTNGTDTVTETSSILQFSVADFAYLARQNGNDALESLTDALMKYGDSAKIYFETLQ